MEFFKTLFSSDGFMPHGFCLSVEPRAGLVPRYLGLSDRPRLLNNSHHSCLFHSQEKRPAVQLDVHLFERLLHIRRASSG